MTDRVFEGLKVIDCASFIAAPVAGTILADFGADVIKIEAPGGDPYRALHLAPGYDNVTFDFGWFADNHSKRGVCLDLKQDAAQDALHRLVEKADVFITNFPMPVREKLKLRYEDLTATNPKLIYASLTAYGEVGPEANRPGFDSTALWARSGLMDLIKPAPDDAPARSAPGMGDHPTGTALFASIAMALYKRATTGEGSYVSTSLVANGAWWNAFYIQAELSGAKVQPRPHRDNSLSALANHYRCKDGRWFILSLVNEMRQIDKFLTAIERMDLLEDPRFATQEARRENAQALIDVLDAVFLRKTWEEWRAALTANGVTFGDVNKLADIANDRTFADAGGIVPTGAGAPADRVVRGPVFMRGQEKTEVRGAPALGEHNDEVMAEIGYSAEEIAAMRAAGVLQ